MKKIAAGSSVFRKVNAPNCIYVDKTEHIFKMLDSEVDFYFLSRPRRFGKSLLVDTLRELFEGNETLFRGLYIHDKWDWSQTYPVIKLDFSGNRKQENQIDVNIYQVLDDLFSAIAEKYNIELQINKDYAGQFNHLINEVYNKYNKQVVILIDEYDKFILDVITEEEQAIKNRELLRGIYSQIKFNIDKVRFVFITGITKFAMTGLFSGLNNLRDITYVSQYADICGITQNELEYYFAEYINDGNVDLAELKRWYNGYNFLGSEEQKVYNPYDLMLFFINGYEYDIHWYGTGSSKYLYDIIMINDYVEEALEIEENQIEVSAVGVNFDIGNIGLVPLMIQAGYLTFGDKLEFGVRGYQLKFPNYEVEKSFNQYLLPKISKAKYRGIELPMALYQKDFSKFKDIMYGYYSAIPYEWYSNSKVANYESFFVAILYAYLRATGERVIAEDSSNLGRSDLVVEIKDKIYIIECKLQKENTITAVDGIKQIIAKKYEAKYQNTAKEIYAIGIVFSNKEHNIVDFAYEKIE